jgi:hypothetical protein
VICQAAGLDVKTVSSGIDEYAVSSALAAHQPADAARAAFARAAIDVALQVLPSLSAPGAANRLTQDPAREFDARAPPVGSDSDANPHYGAASRGWAPSSRGPTNSPGTGCDRLYVRRHGPA